MSHPNIVNIYDVGYDENVHYIVMEFVRGETLKEYIEKHGHPKLRARHLPFKIGVTERDQWVACMAQAMREIGVPDALYERLLPSFYNTADWMRNQDDAVEGMPQMPTPQGIFSPEKKQKLHAITEQYGVEGV